MKFLWILALISTVGFADDGDGTIYSYTSATSRFTQDPFHAKGELLRAAQVDAYDFIASNGHDPTTILTVVLKDMRDALDAKTSARTPDLDLALELIDQDLSKND